MSDHQKMIRAAKTLFFVCLGAWIVCILAGEPGASVQFTLGAIAYAASTVLTWRE